ncbi:MAG TPA: hypothetical protein DIW30_00265 [Bacteroidales bacterium]|nr:hypothetical protein [Bacteroidales bacterium]
MNYNNLFKELQVCSEALDKKLAGIDRQLNTLEARLTEMEKKLNEFQTKLQEPEVEVELLVADEEQELTDVLPAAKEDIDVITEEPAVEKSSARKPVVELPSKNAPVAVEEESENGTINNKETADSMPPSNTGEQHKGASFTERASVSAPPVSDIRKAISLGDRFLFQRELFASDGEKMSKTIDILNKMHSLEEATEYIEKHFQWQEDNPATKLFTSILHRRFS